MGFILVTKTEVYDSFRLRFRRCYQIYFLLNSNLRTIMHFEKHITVTFITLIQDGYLTNFPLLAIGSLKNVMLFLWGWVDWDRWQLQPSCIMVNFTTIMCFPSCRFNCQLCKVLLTSRADECRRFLPLSSEVVQFVDVLCVADEQTYQRPE